MDRKGNAMKLSKRDSELFYKLMFRLQFFVNQTLEILPEVRDLETFITYDSQERVKVRDALYEHIDLIDRFVDENPYGFSEDELAIVVGWKNFVPGAFHVERYLKKYTVFIQDGGVVFGVLGLVEGIDEVIPKNRLPILVDAVLLPFKGCIVYDGLLRPYNVFFGGNIKRRLKETYMTAKQNDRILLSYKTEDGGKPKRKEPPKPEKKWNAELDELARIAKQLKGSKASPAIQSPAFSLTKASIEFARIADASPDDLDALYTHIRKVDRALKKTITVLNRLE